MALLMDPKTTIIVIVSAGIIGFFTSRISLLSKLVSFLFFSFIFLIGLISVNFSISYLYFNLLRRGIVKRSATSSSVIPRVPTLNFIRKNVWTIRFEENDRASKDISFRKPIQGSFIIDDTVDTLINYIMRDFVEKWFIEISKDDVLFSNAVEKSIRHSLSKILSRLKDIDITSFVVRKVIPHLTKHMQDFRTAEVAVRGLGLERSLTESAEADAMLASKYNNGNLHSAVRSGTKLEEVAWLRRLVDSILPLVMPGSEIQSKVVRTLTREIVCNMVLYPLMEMLSDPDFWNEQIDTHAGVALRERKMVKQLRQVLDKKQTDVSGSSLSSMTSTTIRVMLYNYRSAAYETFLEQINKCNNLLDLKRVRSDVITQMRKVRAEVNGLNKTDMINGQSVEDLMNYLNRLGEARKTAEKRILLLSGAGILDDHSKAVMDVSPQPESKPVPNLKEILTNPGNLSYFMEFMDRRHRLVLVQFWLIVEGFKNPLEDVSGSEDEGQGVVAGFVVEPSSGDNAAFKQDAKHLYESYFATGTISVRSEFAEAIKRYIESSVSNVSVYVNARRSILKAQKEIFARMKNEDYPLFIKSDLYFKSLINFPSTSSVVTSGSLQRSSSPLGQQRRGSTSATKPTQSSAMYRDRGYLKRSGTTSNNVGIPPLPSAPPQRTRSSQSISALIDLKSPLFPEDMSFEKPPPVQKPAGEVTPPRSIRSLPTDLFDIDETSNSNSLMDNSNTVNEVQEALRSIVTHDIDDNKIPQDDNKTPQDDNNSTRRIRRPRSLNSLRSGTSSQKDSLKRRKRLFDDDEGEDDEEANESSGGEENKIKAGKKNVMDDVVSTLSKDEDTEEAAVEIAPPGDLDLAAKIAHVDVEISKLESQLGILKQLESKHDLTGRLEELRIVQKSIRAVEREISNLNFQKQQYEAQENQNKLQSGKTQVSISSCTKGIENGKEHALYIVEVQQLDSSGWVVGRRYREFYNLHQRLSTLYPTARQLDFPSKRMVLTRQKGVVEQRRQALDKYLKELIKDPVLCSSRELGQFLSQQNVHMPDDIESTGNIISGDGNSKGSGVTAIAKGQQGQQGRQSRTGAFMTQIYTTVANGIDDLLSTPSMIEAVTQRLGQQVAVASIAMESTSKVPVIRESDEPGDPATILDAGSNVKILTAFTEPLCDLFIEIFELEGSNNWLRRGAIVIIMQQILGGTIERKIRESAKSLMTVDAVLNYLNTFSEALWPGGGEFHRSPKIRTAEQKLKTQSDANRKLSTLLPDLASNVIGRSNARKGARKLFALFQNRRLNQHILYQIVEEVIREIFPDREASG